jgi:capsular polysaccharide biosynthesis protein
MNHVEPKNFNSKIFWPRLSKYRVNSNSSRIEKLLKNQKFVVQNPANMTFIEQVESISSASTLVAVGGALMSNFIFASSNSKIIVLVSDLGTAYPWPIMLARISGAEVIMVGGRTLDMGRLETLVQKTHASFRTRVSEFKRSLKNSQK